jgi:hypothetical protein
MEYTYQLFGNPGPLKLLVIDPETLSQEQKDALLKGTEGYKRGINYWPLSDEDSEKYRVINQKDNIIMQKEASKEKRNAE